MLGPLDPNAKGNIAEQAIVFAAMKRGVPVLTPVGEHGRTDLALDVGGRLWRVQCKWGHLNGNGDVVVVRLRACRHTPQGYVHGTYDEQDADLIGVYCSELDRCFLIPISRAAGMTCIHLRLVPARNGQRACTNLATEFDFNGAIAQLGERRHGMAEVVGSSPTSSTSQTPRPA